MKQDWEIIRKLLIKIEELPTEDSDFNSNDLAGYDNDMVAYQMRLMIEAGLIEGGCRNSFGAAPLCHANSLTWKGHELLNSIRRETIWNAVKNKAREKGVDLTVGIILTAAKSIVEKLML